MSHSSLETMTNAPLPMNVESVELLVRQTIAKRLRIDLNEVQLDTNFDDLNLDSLDLAELFFLLEDQLKKQIHVDQTTNLKTVSDVVGLVMRNR
jgi:acyl carrier protein